MYKRRRGTAVSEKPAASIAREDLLRRFFAARTQLAPQLEPVVRQVANLQVHGSDPIKSKAKS